MKSSIRKIFVNFEKEEKWLNDMASKGLNFIHYSPIKYLFEQGTPGEYIYRLELLDKQPSHPESKAYIEFMEGTGAECVDTYLRWVYFRKRAADGAFDIYSDYDSRIKHYKRILNFMGTLWGLNIGSGIYNLWYGLVIGADRGFYFNAYFSSLNWLVAVAFIPMLVSYYKKIRKMRKEKQLYE